MIPKIKSLSKGMILKPIIRDMILTNKYISLRDFIREMKKTRKKYLDPY